MSSKRSKRQSTQKSVLRPPDVTYSQAMAFTQGQLAASGAFHQLKSEYPKSLLLDAVQAYQAGVNQMLNELAATINVRPRTMKK